MPTGNTQQQINYGATANDGQGDPLRTAFIKTDDNFDNVWLAGPVGSNVRITNNTIGVLDTNGNLILSPNGVGVIQTNNHVVPRLNRTYDLGTANLTYRTVYANTATFQTLGLAGNLSVGGNLTVSGNIIQVGNIVTETLTIQLANAASTANAANGAGITVGANDNIATLLYNSTGNVWTTNIGVSTVGNVTAPYFIGNGSQLTGIVTSSYANANVVAYGQAGWAGNIIPSGNGVYSLGNATNQWNDLYVSNATIYMNNIPLSMTAGNVLTVNGQPVLSNDSNTAITTTGNITANYFIGDGSQLTGISSTGNLDIVGTAISIAAGADETIITISPNGESQAYLQIPNDATANTANVRMHNDVGNIEFGTGSGSYLWYLDNTGNLTMPNGGYINFVNTGGITQSVNEDLRFTVSDDEEDGWAIQSTVNDGAGNDLTRMQVRYDGIRINTDVPTNNYSWDFRDSGEFDVPKSIRGPVGGNLVISIGDQFGAGPTFIDLQTRSYVGDALISNIRIGDPDVTVSTSNGTQNWSFGSTGNLTVPGNIQSISTGFAFSSGIVAINYSTPPVITTADNVFSGSETGQVTISGVNPPVQANGTWYYEAVATNGFALYLDAGLTQPVDPSEWPGYVDGGLAVSLGYSNLAITAGNVRIVSNYGETWTFEAGGALRIPNDIVSNATIDIDNRASGNTADIRLYSADDIELQARDRTAGSGSEGGDINIYAGDSAEDGDSSGGDIQLIAGNGGAGNVDFGGSGGFITIRSGDGGAAIGNSGGRAESGGSLTLNAGDAGDNNGNIDLGANGGDIFIEAGFSTGNTNTGGNIVLTTGTGGQNGTSGNVQINIPGYGLTTGGTWIFDATGNLNLPSSGNIVGQTANNNGYLSWVGNSSGDNNGYTTMRLVPDNTREGGDQYLIIDPTAPGHIHIRAGGTQDNSSADLILGGENSFVKIAAGGNSDVFVRSNSNDWRFGTNGVLTFPGTPRIDTDGNNFEVQAAESVNFEANAVVNIYTDTSGTTYQWQFGDDGALTFPDGANIVDGAFNGTASSTVSLNAFSPGGNTVSFQAQGNTSSAVISIFSNAGPVTSNWTFTTAPLDPGESFLYVPNGGAISTPDATGGEGGKNIFIQAGASDPVTWNSNPGGDLFIKGGYGSFGDGGGGAGGDVYIEGGASSDSHAGNVNISSGLNTWVFDYTGNLTIPNGMFAQEIASPAPVISGFTFIGSLSGPVSTTGNVTAGNVNVTTATGNLVLGKASATGSPGLNSTNSLTVVTDRFGTPKEWVFTTAGDFTGSGNISGGNLSVTGQVSGQTLSSTQSTANEGGEITLAIPSSGSTLSTSITIDSYQNRLRFFETGGSTRGMFIDLANMGNITTSDAQIGYINIPQVSFSANATAALSDSGKHYYSTTAGNLALTLPDNSNVAFATGTTLTIVVNAAGNVLVNQGTGVSLYMAGSSATGNRAVGAYGLASVMKVAANTWVISGTGVY